jgi:hypothetical protein
MGQGPKLILIGILTQPRFEKLLCTQPMCETGAQDFPVRDATSAEHHMLVLHKRLQGFVKMFEPDATRPDIGAIPLAWQIARSTQDCLAQFYGFVEWATLEAMERVVVNKGPHRPILADDLAGEADHRPELHPLGIAVARYGH